MTKRKRKQGQGYQHPDKDQRAKRFPRFLYREMRAWEQDTGRRIPDMVRVQWLELDTLGMLVEWSKWLCAWREERETNDDPNA